MFKYLYWAALLSIGLLLTMSEEVFSKSIFTDSQYPEVQNPNLDPPLCYIETIDGKVRDLQKLCFSSVRRSGNNGVTSSPFRRDCSVIRCGTSSRIRQTSSFGQ